MPQSNEPNNAAPVAPMVQAALPDGGGDARPGMQALDALHRDDDEAALIVDPSSPLHALYRQALHGLELLGDPRLRDRRELERLAVMIAMRAGASGLQRIERVVPSGDGLGFHFVDDRSIDPGLRGYVAHAQSGPAPEDRAAAEATRVRLAQDRQQEQRNADHAHREADLRRHDPQRRP